MALALCSTIRSWIAAVPPFSEKQVLGALSLPARVFIFPGRLRAIDPYIHADQTTLNTVEDSASQTLQTYRTVYAWAEYASKERGMLSLRRAQLLKPEAYYAMDILSLKQGSEAAHKTAVNIGILLLNWRGQNPERRKRYEGLHVEYEAIKHRAGFFADAYTYSGIPLKNLMQQYPKASKESSNNLKNLVLHILEEFEVVVSLHRQNDSPSEFQACLQPLILELMETLKFLTVRRRSFEYIVMYYRTVSREPDLPSRYIEGIQQARRILFPGERPSDVDFSQL